MKKEEQLLTFGGHLDVLRKMLFRIFTVVAVLSAGVFMAKDAVFRWLLAPCDNRFMLYTGIERAVQQIDPSFRFEDFSITLISTELSAQFMTHLSTSLCLGALLASPYIVIEGARFVAPALYADERRLLFPIGTASYALFLLGIAMTYFVLFPVSLRFLGTYQVAEGVANQITISSYIGTFLTLSLVMGLVFQVPVAVYILARKGLVEADMLRTFRRHAFLVILLVSAIITPPDLFTLVLVALPLYALYEVSILIAKRVKHS